MHELQRVLEREIRHLAGSIFGQPQGSALDGSAEADASVGWTVIRTVRRKATRLGGRQMHRPSPALVVACLALLVALGGTSYATVLNVPGTASGRSS